jgi:hypothetical protein
MLKLSEKIHQGEKGRVLYHIGYQAPMPRPMKSPHVISDSEEGWARPWLKAPVSAGVFLTDDPTLVLFHHGVDGSKVYSVFVPFWVIKESGGLHVFMGAKEVIVPEELWQHCKILSSKDVKEYDKAIEDIRKKEDKTFEYLMIEKPQEEKKQPLTDEQFREILKKDKIVKKNYLSKRASEMSPWLDAYSKLQFIYSSLQKILPIKWTISYEQLQEMYNDMFPEYVSAAMVIRNLSEELLSSNAISRPMVDKANDLISKLNQIFKFEV